MSRTVSYSQLDANSTNIVRTMIANAPPEYKHLIPKVKTADDLPKVGQYLEGHPGIANWMLNNLINAICAPVIRGAVWENPLSALGKGPMPHGTTIPEYYVNISKAREFNASLAMAREFQVNMPDVQSAFHVVNWDVQYTQTYFPTDLTDALLEGETGMNDLIARILSSMNTSAAYDEYLLYKYVLIKSITSGFIKPVFVKSGASAKETNENLLKKSRATSSRFAILSPEFNRRRVHNVALADDQWIFMDADRESEVDVDVLASNFHMEKADYIGHRTVIDDWTSFDNNRWEELRKTNSWIEEVTAEELAVMKKVMGVLASKEFFMFFDKIYSLTSVSMASADNAVNTFLHVRKAISKSPFANIVVFMEGDEPAAKETITVKAIDEVTGENGRRVVSLGTAEVDGTDPALEYLQTETLTREGVGVTKTGTYLFNADSTAATVTIEAKHGNILYKSSPVNVEEFIEGGSWALTKQA